MRNPAGTSSKENLVESLLRLGDIARNSHVGEVQVALGKAKLFIDKYGLMQFDGRYQQMVEKLAAFLRGEKVTREEEPKREDPFAGFGAGFDPFARHKREQERRRQREAARGAYRQARQQRAERQREEKRQQRQSQRAARPDAPIYHRPRVDDEIIWLWTLQFVPKRGKAGERWKAYYPAKTVREFLKCGGRWSDVKWNIQHGYMKIRENE